MTESVSGQGKASDSQLDDKEKRLAGPKLTLDERARSLREGVPDVVRRQQEAIDRSQDVLARADRRLVQADESLRRSRAAIKRNEPTEGSGASES
jgi:hypothetical protein